MRLPLALCAASLLAGCSMTGVETNTANQPVIVPLTTAQVATVQDTVKRSLKDPYSAVFGDVKAAQQDNGSLRVCGLVNSKNAFGGYVGDTPYEGTLTGSTFSIELMDTGAPYSTNMCKSFGVAI